MTYFCKLTPDTGGFTVSFRDIPEALTQSDTQADALANAADALLTALEFYFDDRRIVPAASAPKRGEHAVSIPAIVSAKLRYTTRWCNRLKNALCSPANCI